VPYFTVPTHLQVQIRLLFHRCNCSGNELSEIINSVSSKNELVRVTTNCVTWRDDNHTCAFHSFPYRHLALTIRILSNFIMASSDHHEHDFKAQTSCEVVEKFRQATTLPPSRTARTPRQALRDYSFPAQSLDVGKLPPGEDSSALPGRTSLDPKTSALDLGVATDGLWTLFEEIKVSMHESGQEAPDSKLPTTGRRMKVGASPFWNSYKSVT
jgi:hypothetical protein